MGLSAFDLNPIARAELTHQRRTTRPPYRWQRWIWRPLYIVVLEVALILFWGEVAGAILWRDTRPIANTLGALVILFIVVTIGMHLYIVLRAFAAGANSIVREKVNGTWEPLMLTGIDARRLVRGKWWGTLRMLTPEIIRLIPLRAALAVWLGATVSQIYTVLIQSPFNATMVPPTPLLLLVAVPIIGLFTVLSAALATAVGVLASAASPRTGIALGLAVIVFFLLTVISISGVDLAERAAASMLQSDNYATRSVVPDGLDAAKYTLIENGTAVTSMLATYQLNYPIGSEYEYYGTYSTQNRGRLLGTQLIGTGVGIALLVGATWICLRLAEWFAVRVGALQHQPT